MSVDQTVRGAHREFVETQFADPAYEDDGLAADLAAAAPRRWWNRATLWLGAAVLLVGGFAAGAQTQKSYGSTADAGVSTRGGAGQGGIRGGFPSGGLPTAFRGGAQGTSGGQNGAGVPGGSGGGTTGTVKLVDGSTVYVQTASGDVVTVRTGARTAVRIAKQGALKDLTAGDTVTVEGSTSDDGTVTATTVTGEKK